MIAFIRSKLRILLKEVGRHIFIPIVYAFIRRPCKKMSSVSVHILISSKSWKLGVIAISSLEFFSKRKWNVFFHDDGTLSDEIKKNIILKMPGSNLISRKDADERLSAVLSFYPACKRNRLRHNLFLKFFDPFFYSPEEKYLILDSDLFFYRFPKSIVEWIDSKQEAFLYNLDPTELYAIPSKLIEKKLQINMWEKFNSGLVCVPKNGISMQLSEKLLETFESNANHPQFFEQTLYALNASVFNKGGALPSQYEISWNIFRNFNSVCRHYVGGAKDDHLFFEAPMNLFFLMTLPSFFRKY